jgi:hypothetical protein
MRKTLAAGALVLLVVGPASIRAGAPALRRVSQQQDSAGADYLPPPQSLPSVPTDTVLPSPGAATPAPGPAEVPENPTASPVPAAPAVPAGCAGCAAECQPHQRFECLRRLIAWATYCPLQKGVNCPGCKKCPTGECCRYHSSMPLYLFFMDHCVNGAIPSPACGGCGCCGGAALAAAGPAPVATGTESGGTGTAPSTEGPALSGDGTGSGGERTGFLGTRRMFSLFSGSGGGSAGSR